MRPLVLAMIVVVFLTSPLPAQPLPGTGTIEVFFTPPGGPTEATIREIQRARSEILIQAYSLTSVPIAKALTEAKRRGIRIEAVLDKSNATARYTAATFLANNGIPIWIDRNHAIAHNKVMILDRRVVITGSFNFTKAAETKNAENLLVLRDNVPLVEAYLANYLSHKKHSEAYAPNL